MLSDSAGSLPDISIEDIELGIQRFASTLPAEDRIQHLLNADPLHIDADGTVRG